MRGLQSLGALSAPPFVPTPPRLLAATHPIALQLVNLQYPPPRPSDPLAADEPRFEALCRLFTTSIVHAWEFKGQNVAIETVTACALAPLVDAMGSATIRYLQILMPHLTDLLVTTATAGGDGTWTVDTATMMLAASRALVAVVRNARLRMRRWEGKIGVAVSQCWIGMHESKTAQALQAGSQEGSAAIEELKESLADLLRELEGVSDTPVSPLRFCIVGVRGLIIDIAFTRADCNATCTICRSRGSRLFPRNRRPLILESGLQGADM